MRGLRNAKPPRRGWHDEGLPLYRSNRWHPIQHSGCLSRKGSRRCHRRFGSSHLWWRPRKGSQRPFSMARMLRCEGTHRLAILTKCVLHARGQGGESAEPGQRPPPLGQVADGQHIHLRRPPTKRTRHLQTPTISVDGDLSRLFACLHGGLPRNHRLTPSIRCWCYEPSQEHVLAHVQTDARQQEQRDVLRPQTSIAQQPLRQGQLAKPERGHRRWGLSKDREKTNALFCKEIALNDQIEGSRSGPTSSVSRSEASSSGPSTPSAAALEERYGMFQTTTS